MSSLFLFCFLLSHVSKACVLWVQVTTPCDMSAKVTAVGWTILGIVDGFEALGLVGSGMGGCTCSSKCCCLGVSKYDWFSFYWNYYFDVNFIAFVLEKSTFPLIKKDNGFKIDDYEGASSAKPVEGIFAPWPQNDSIILAEAGVGQRGRVARRKLGNNSCT